MICARVSLISFILLSNFCLQAAEFKSFGELPRDDSMTIAIQKELPDPDRRCRMSLAFFTDAYGLLSEFLFLGGKIILPCSCSRTFCDHLEFGYMEPFLGQTSLDRFKALSPKLFQNTKLGPETLGWNFSYIANRIANVAIIEVTHEFLKLGNNYLKNGIYCTCNGSQEKAARVNLPTYRVCSEKECQKSCQNMPPGAPEICSVSFWDEVNCEIRSPNKTDDTTCFGSHQCHPDLSCPIAQYLSFKDNHGMCLYSNDTYWRHGMCQAYHKNLLDDLTWEVHFHSKIPGLNIIMEFLGVKPHLSNSCEKDLGSHLTLGGRWDIRVLQTYQLTDASTSLLLFNGSACSRHTNPLKAFLCQNLNCSKRTLLPGNCDVGWEILLKDFTQFRHQIRVTNVKDINVAPLFANRRPESPITKIRTLVEKVIPQDAHFARFFIIPDRILMINRNETTSDGNVTTVKKVCLFPGGNKAAKGNTCMTEKEIHWMSCYPKIQKFIINQRPTLTSLISSTASNGEAPWEWWKYALIAIVSLVVASLFIFGIVMYVQMRRRNRPAERLALFKMPTKAEMDDMQRSPILLKDFTSSAEVSFADVTKSSDVAVDTEVSFGTVTKSSDVAVDPTQESSEKSKNRRRKTKVMEKTQSSPFSRE